MAFRFWLGDFSFSCGTEESWNGLAPAPGCGVSGPSLQRPCPLPSGALTLILWKFTLQLAPALEGMKRSPCLLGEDTGELAGVRVRRISATWKDGRLGLGASGPPKACQGQPGPPCLLHLAAEGRVRSWKPEGQEEPETLAHSDHDGQKARNEGRLSRAPAATWTPPPPTRRPPQSRGPPARPTCEGGRRPRSTAPAMSLMFKGPAVG